MSETLLKQITDMRLKGSKLRRVPRSQIKDRSRAVIPKIKQNKDLPDRLELPEPVASTYTGLPEIPAPKIATYEFRDYSSKAPKQHFECPTCTKQFSVKNVPKVLECGESVCQECVVNVVNNIDKELNEFHCQACGECHAIPEYRVFKNNKFLLKLLKLPYFPAIPKDPEVLAIKEDLQKAPVIIAEPTPGTSSNIETSEPIQEPEELKNITEKPKKLSPEPVKVRDPSPEVIETEEPCEKDEEELNQIPEPIDEDIVEKPVKKSFNKKVKVIDSDFDVLLEKTLKSEAPKTGSSSGGGGSGSKLQQLEVILTSKGLDKVMEYCEDMRTDIQWCTELGVGTIQEQSEVLLKRIDEFESECTRSLSEQIKRIHEFDEQWKVYLAECGVDDSSVEAAAAEVLKF